MRTFEKVDENNIFEAGEVYSLSWKTSHLGIVGRDFYDKHTPEFQSGVIQGKLMDGWEFVLCREETVASGIISFNRKLAQIATLYVHPDHWNKGIGTSLLFYAIDILKEYNNTPWLTVLSSNTKAEKIYLSHGFTFSGKQRLVDPKINLYEKIYIYKYKGEKL